MKGKELFKSPWILFLPLLFIYIIMVFLKHEDAFFGDENRYFYYAKNLLQGFYSPPPPGIWLDKGPGYSILLMPFVAMNFPLIFYTLLNALFLYSSVVLLFLTLKNFISFRFNVVITLFWGFYFNSFENIHLMIPEVFPTFLVSLAFYFLVKGFNENVKTYSWVLIIAGIILGFLALTKVVFIYVLLVMGLFIILLLVFEFRSRLVWKSFFVLIVALLSVSPYLYYTYNLTGKHLYLSSVGGNNLYWMSTPFEGEYGSWYPFHKVEIDSFLYSQNPLREKIIKERHGANHEYFFSLQGTAQDEAYKQVAIKNIKDNPKKFLLNCFSNVGRIFFNFPYSLDYQKPSTLLRLPFNGTILVFSLLLIIPTVINWRKIDFTIRFMLVFSLIYFGGSIFGSAETRMFNLIVPVLLTWISFMLNKLIVFRYKFDEK